ncbi:MAG: ThiF family adenylyltransferase [Desulfobacula sp.]|jgi:molybdopterin/thiamine biosynthesis adenylyltransferase|nr:ThiF family adenylyltransferase [Desulfobacula sp.]
MEKSSVLLLSGNLLAEKFSKPGIYEIYLKSRDDGDVFSLLNSGQEGKFTPGSLCMSNNENIIDPETFGSNKDYIRISITDNSVRGFIKQKDGWHNIPVNIIPIKEKLYSKNKGLSETNVLSQIIVLIIGLGSVGSIIAAELAKAGIRHFKLIDDDRLEIGNVSHHAAGLSDVGRYKVNVVADMILNINPYAKIKRIIRKAEWIIIDMVREMIQSSYIVVCATDTRDSKLLINRVCNEENTKCIFAGCLGRAYGVQVLNVHPFKTVCYQCFCMQLPEVANDVVVSSDMAQRISYSDRPVAVEPGLSNDITPVCTMAVKLIIQELLKGNQTTTLRSLDEDLIAPWYLWLNRREKGTPYENLKPLGYDRDGLKILRWYGIDMKRDPYCPVCGDH